MRGGIVLAPSYGYRGLQNIGRFGSQHSTVLWTGISTVPGGHPSNTTTGWTMVADIVLGVLTIESRIARTASCSLSKAFSFTSVFSYFRDLLVLPSESMIYPRSRRWHDSFAAYDNRSAQGHQGTGSLVLLRSNRRRGVYLVALDEVAHVDVFAD